jgi:ubiquinone/menaquinone biosynthesis C-methylase UbiE
MKENRPAGNWPSALYGPRSGRTSASALREEIRKYWDRRCSYYDSCPGTNGRAESEDLWREELIRVVPTGGNIKILDVGTGTGFLSFLLEKEGHEITAVDFSVKMLEVARAKGAARGSRISFVRADAEALPFEPETFDAVVSRFLLWTLPDPQRALKEWKRVLRPGGKIVVIDGFWRYTSFAQRTSGCIRRCYQAVTEGKKLFTRCYSNAVTSRLPFGRGLKKEALRQVLLDAGLEEVQIMDAGHLMAEKVRHLPWYLRPAYYFPIFIASAQYGGR